MFENYIYFTYNDVLCIYGYGIFLVLPKVMLQVQAFKKSKP